MDRMLKKVREAAEAAAQGPTGSYADVPASNEAAWAAFVQLLVQRGAPPQVVDREALGRLVREVWVVWAKQNPVPCTACSSSTPAPCALCNGTGTRLKESWLVPWEGLTEEQREVDRRIGEAIGVYTLVLIASLPLKFSKDSLQHMAAVLTSLKDPKEPKP